MPIPRSAAFVSQNCPITMVAGQTYRVNVIMRNTGTARWTPAELIRLGSQGTTNWGTSRVGLTRVVEPNRTNAFVFNVTAPAAGKHNFQWRMVHDGGGGGFGAFTPNVVVVVTAAGVTPSPVPTPTPVPSPVPTPTPVPTPAPIPPDLPAAEVSVIDMAKAMAARWDMDWGIIHRELQRAIGSSAGSFPIADLFRSNYTFCGIAEYHSVLANYGTATDLAWTRQIPRWALNNQSFTDSQWRRTGRAGVDAHAPVNYGLHYDEIGRPGFGADPAKDRLESWGVSTANILRILKRIVNLTTGPGALPGNPHWNPNWIADARPNIVLFNLYLIEVLKFGPQDIVEPRAQPGQGGLDDALITSPTVVLVLAEKYSHVNVGLDWNEQVILDLWELHGISGVSWETVAAATYTSVNAYIQLRKEYLSAAENIKNRADSDDATARFVVRTMFQREGIQPSRVPDMHLDNIDEVLIRLGVPILLPRAGAGDWQELIESLAVVDALVQRIARVDLAESDIAGVWSLYGITSASFQLVAQMAQTLTPAQAFKQLRELEAGETGPGMAGFTAAVDALEALKRVLVDPDPFTYLPYHLAHLSKLIQAFGGFVKTVIASAPLIAKSDPSLALRVQTVINQTNALSIRLFALRDQAAAEAIAIWGGIPPLPALATSIPFLHAPATHPTLARMGTTGRKRWLIPAPWLTGGTVRRCRPPRLLVAGAGQYTGQE